MLLISEWIMSLSKNDKHFCVTFYSVGDNFLTGERKLIIYKLYCYSLDLFFSQTMWLVNSLRQSNLKCWHGFRYKENVYVQRLLARKHHVNFLFVNDIPLNLHQTTWQTLLDVSETRASLIRWVSLNLKYFNNSCFHIMWLNYNLLAYF